MQTTSSEPQSDYFTRVVDFVRIVGHVRPQNRKQLQELGTTALDDYGRCTIDLKEAAYIDSSGIATLITLAEYARRQRKDLVIANATPEFRQLLERLSGTSGRSALFTFAEASA